MSIPALAELCILGLAFYKMDRLGAYKNRFQLSKSQLWLQLSANAAFFLSEVIILIGEEGSPLESVLTWISVLCNAFGLTVLLLTMMGLAKIQLEHDVEIRTHIGYNNSVWSDDVSNVSLNENENETTPQED